MSRNFEPLKEEKEFKEAQLKAKMDAEFGDTMAQLEGKTIDTAKEMEDLDRLARGTQALICLSEALRQVRTGKRAEIAGNPSALSSSLNVWVLLSRGLQVCAQKGLAADSILVLSQVEERLLLVEVSSALCVLE